MPYYGINGFYLPFKNNANTRELGFDYSGQAPTTNAYTVTVAGNAQISTAQSKFGGSSAFFDGSGDSVSFTYSSLYSFGTQDFTIECWFRTSSLAANNTIFFAGNDGNFFNGIYLGIGSNGSLNASVYDGSTGLNLASSASIVSTNTWYHIAVVRSGTSLKIYLDGTERASGTTSVSVGTATISPIVTIGRLYGANNQQQYMNGYIDDLRVYRGLAKYTSNFTAPTSAIALGSADPNWPYCILAMPMDGTNASTSFAAYAPNNWTPNNFSVTAGAGNDSLVDVPTLYGSDTGLGGQVRGNYATFNPVGSSTSMILANGNLDVTTTSTVGFNAYSTIAVSSGKWYCEATINSSTDATAVGVCPATANAASTSFHSLSGGISYYYTGQKIIAGTTSAYGASYANGNIVGIALDMDTQTVTFYKNGVSQGAITSSMTANLPYYFATTDSSSATNINQSWNFGQRPFTFSAPAGFKALCTTNLP
jgi:hypothetical protein